MSKTILVLGAGTGGIVATKGLSKKLKGTAKIILFEKEEKNVFAPSLLWLMVGKRKPKQIYKNTKKLEGSSVQVVLGEIEKVNPELISVMVKGKEYKGDYMIVSLGAEQTTQYELDKWGHNFYTLDGAAGFNTKLQNFKGGKIAVLVPSLPFKCPAAPYEAAMLVQNYIRKKGLEKITEVALYSPEPGPMGVAGKELSEAVKGMVEQNGVRYYPEHQLISATEKWLSFSNDKTIGFDLLAFTPKHQCPPVIRDTALINESGWVAVDRYTMETSFSNVYAIGDITNIPLEMRKTLPKAGVFAHYQAEVVAHNIVRKISGKAPDKKFSGYGQCFLEIGNGKAGYAGGNFYGSPLPEIKMKRPGFIWHWAKVWFEKRWLLRNF